MNDILNLTKRVVNKEEFTKVIQTGFTTYTQEYTNNPNPEDLLTVEQFFTEYNRLYFQIPVTGEQNSHEYIVRRSGELSNLNVDTFQVNLLLDEIQALRGELIEAYRQLQEINQQ